MEKSRSEIHEQKQSKTEYFAGLLFKYYPHMKFLLQEGKLTRRDNEGNKLSKDNRGNWSNVLEHCLVEAAAAEALADALGLEPEKKKQLAEAAAVHDWDKRAEVVKKDFSDKERAAAEAAFTALNPNRELLEATHAEFLKRWINGEERSREQKLLCYIDDICEGSEIMPCEPRLKAAAGRQKGLATDTSWSEAVSTKLGRSANFFDGQLAMEMEVEEEIFNELKARGFDELQSPADVAPFIKRQVEKNYAR